MPLIRAGKLKAYGITMARPSALTPGIEPLATLLNLPGFDVGAWIGIMVATGTPKPVVDRLSAAMATVMQAQDVRERLTGVGLEIDYLPAEEFSRYLKDQKTNFAEIVKRANIKVD
jgi:tripartite-type tricarboxylate transporter receptor subunit TctC